MVYGARLLGAVTAAMALYVFAQDKFGISRQTIIFDSLSSAGILSVVCAVSALRARK